MTLFFAALLAFFFAMVFEAALVPWIFGFFLPLSLWMAILAFAILPFRPAVVFTVFAGTLFAAAFPGFGALRVIAFGGALSGMWGIRHAFDEEPLSRFISFSAGVFLVLILEPFIGRIFFPHLGTVFSWREVFVEGLFVLVVSLFWIVILVWKGQGVSAARNFLSRDL